MGQFINLVGSQFGQLIVIKRVDNSKANQIRWLCKCQCGNQLIVQGGHLRSGHTKSCGCLRIRIVQQLKYKHGYANSCIYKIWKGMIQRCTNVNNKEYKNYGGRGIKVCDRWQKLNGQGFLNFRKDMGKRPPNKTLDRINNNGNYCKKNCRWATIQEQNRNSRHNMMIIINGEIKPLVEWCEIYHISYSKVYQRIYKLHWTPREALELISRRIK